MTEKELLKATHQGILKIGDNEIECAVLEDGIRVITQTSFLKALGRSIRPVAGQGASFEKVPAFLAPKNLKPFISKELYNSMTPIKYKPLKGGYKGKAFGYKAEILPEVCYVYIDSFKAKKLLPTQFHMKNAAEIIVRGLATVGIIALVDEATGYQEVRDRLALQKILDKYIRDEYRSWTQMFPAEFYRQMFRLKGWPYDERQIKRPSVIGHYTNDIVYGRLAPGILKKVQEKNPTTEKGYRKQKHHQWFTDNVGIPELKEHLIGLIALMKASPNWRKFMGMVERVYTKYGDTIPMDFEDN